MLLSYLSFFTFCACITMGIIGLMFDPKGGTNRAFAVFSFIVSVWAFGDIFYNISKDYKSAWFWYRVTAVGWCGMVYGIFYLYSEFSGYYKKISIYIKLLVFIYTIILIIIQFTEKLIYRQTPYGPIEEIDIFAPGFYLLHSALVLLVIVSTFLTVKTILTSRSKRVKKMLTLFLIFGCITYIAGIGLNVVQALIDKPLPPFGSFFMLIFLPGILYLVIRYRLLKLDYSILQNEAIDMLSDLVIIVSNDEQIIKLNKSAKSIFKHIPINISGFFTGEKEFDKYLSEAVKNKNKIEKKYMFVRGNEKNIPVYLSIYPIFDNFNDYIGSSMICKPLNNFEKIANEYKISPQERKIIFYLMEGFLNKEISTKMNISESTIKNYITNIYKKTKVVNKVELMKLFFVQEI